MRSCFTFFASKGLLSLPSLFPLRICVSGRRAATAWVRLDAVVISATVSFLLFLFSSFFFSHTADTGIDKITRSQFGRGKEEKKKCPYVTAILFPFFGNWLLMLDWISLTVFVLSEGRYWSLTQRQLHCAEDAASPITTRTEVNVNTVIGGFTTQRYSHLFTSYWLCVSFHAFSTLTRIVGWCL